VQGESDRRGSKGVVVDLSIYKTRLRKFAREDGTRDLTGVSSEGSDTLRNLQVSEVLRLHLLAIEGGSSIKVSRVRPEGSKFHNVESSVKHFSLKGQSLKKRKD